MSQFLLLALPIPSHLVPFMLEFVCLIEPNIAVITVQSHLVRPQGCARDVSEASNEPYAKLLASVACINSDVLDMPTLDQVKLSRNSIHFQYFSGTCAPL